MAFVDLKSVAKGPRIPRSAVEPASIKAKLKQMNVPAAPSRSRGAGGSSRATAAVAVAKPKSGKKFTSK